MGQLSNETRPPRRGTRYLFLLAGVLLVGALLWYLDPTTVLTALRTAQPLPLLATTALTVAGFWIRAWKWRHGLGPGRQAVGLFFVAKMAGHWSPGRVGELSPLLFRDHRNTRMAAWILLDRAVEALTTLAFGLAGAALLGLAPVWLIGLAAAAMAFAAPLAFGLRPPAAWAECGGWVGRAGRLLAGLHEELRDLGTRAPVLLAATLLAKVTDVLGVVYLCRAFGYPVSFLLVCVARCAHAIVSGVPLTPDATGIPFAAAGYFLHAHGGIPVETLVAAFGMEVAIINVVLYISFFIGVTDLRRTEPEGKTDHDRPDG